MTSENLSVYDCVFFKLNFFYSQDSDKQLIFVNDWKKSSAIYDQ